MAAGHARKTRLPLALNHKERRRKERRKPQLTRRLDSAVRRGMKTSRRNNENASSRRQSKSLAPSALKEEQPSFMAAQMAVGVEAEIEGTALPKREATSRYGRLLF
jgi:hypothetical protein